MPKQAASEPRYNPFHRFEWLEYVEDDAGEDVPPIRVKVRANLTFGELEKLTWDNDPDLPVSELWPLFAPYVVDWNLSGLDEDGNDVELPAPATAGPEQFQYIPPALFWELVRDIKLRSTRPLERKRASASGSTPATPSAPD